MPAQNTTNTASSPDEYPGQGLGRPATGPGSLARVPRRILALLIDWYLCYGLVWFLAGSPDGGTMLLVSGLFWLYQSLLVGVSGHTLGHFVCGMQVQFRRGDAVSLLAATVRGLLVALAIPVFIVDQHGRGLQDRAMDTVLVRIR